MLRLGLAVVSCSALLVMSGCGGGSAVPAGPTGTSTQASSAVSATSSTAPTSGADGSTAPCLFTLRQVSRVLGGRWTRTAKVGQPCAYGSDRGAAFATNRVDDDPVSGLRDARAACVKGVRPIATAQGGFVCVEPHPGGDAVVGNVATGGRLWLVVIPLSKGADPTPQLGAMVALMNGALG